MIRRAAVLSMLLALGCAEPVEEAPAPPPAGPRIAFARDFEGFRAWTRHRMPTESLTDGHVSSPNRYVYIDRPAPALPGELPEGTIIVKTVQDGAPQDWEIHAMVKRGGGYNPDGSVGWEFFALRYDEDGELYVAWRGLGDDGATYVDPETGEAQACNTCHVIGAERDFVFSRELLATGVASEAASR